MHTPLIGLFNRARSRYVRCASDDTAYLGFATEDLARTYNSSNGNLQGIEYCEIDLSREVSNEAPPRDVEPKRDAFGKIDPTRRT